MLRHTSIHTYNIPEETNPLSGYVLCVWSEHGRTRLLNTPGGAQRECRRPLFSTLQHAAHKHSCPSHGPFVPYRFVEVPVMDTVSFLWTFTSDCYTPFLDKHAHQCIISFQGRCRNNHAWITNATDAGKHAYACRHWIIVNALNRNTDNYPKNNTPKRWQAYTELGNKCIYNDCTP